MQFFTTKSTDMRKFACFLIFACALFASLPGWTQQGRITGTVISDTGPLEGVTITNTATQQRTGTNKAGFFSISAARGQTLVFSFVGFDTKEVVIGNDNSISVSLTSSQNVLNDVVVVGYGTQRKANLTGAVSTVDVAKAFGSKPLSDPTKALQGVVPGLTILYGNGGLTAGAAINIRGVGSVNGTGRPLILVDNVQTDDLSVINPNDIESISVLKDAASASIYGARAAFGVVLIKTKTGKKNQKPVVSYNNYFSWNTPTVLPNFADPVAELDALNAAGIRAGTSSPETFGMNLVKLRAGIQNWEQKYAGTNTGTVMVKGEDWNIDPSDGRTYFYKVWDPKKEILNKYTHSMQHNISVQGGSESLSYYMSGAFSSDDGIIKMNPEKVNKYNFTLGLNSTVNKWLDLSAKTMYRNFRYDYPFQYQDYWYYFWRWGAYFPYGTYQDKYFRVNSAYLNDASRANITDNYQRVDFGATIKINQHFNIRADYTIGRDNSLRHESGGPVVAWDFWTAGVLALSDIASATTNQVTYTEGRLLVNTLNAYGTYQNTFGKRHNVKVIAGVNSEKDENINFLARKAGLLDPSQAEIGLTYGAATVSTTGSGVPNGWSTNGHGKQAFAGYFGRINYDYKGKYLLELNGRYDGSSAFSPLDRWAFFPSASVGYRLSEENFMQSAKPIISDLKIRASYGTLGNQDVGGNYYLRTMNGGQGNWLDNSGTYVQYITQPTAVANALEWEKVTTRDLGVDLRVLKNHLGVTFDWYERNTEGMIQSTSVPSTFGTGGPKINAGNFRNRGFEITLDGNYSVNKNLQLYATASLSDGKTVFTKWSNPNQSISTAFNYEGKTYGEIWGFVTDGYFADANDVTKSASQKTLQSGNFVFGPGDIKYKDLNGDGKIDGGKMTLADHGDLQVIGNTQPRYQYNARVGGNWKNFDFDVFIQGVGKRSMWAIGQNILPLWQSTDILFENQLDYWTPSNTNAKYPALYPGSQTGTVAGLQSGGNNFYPQSKYILNLAYCRLKNVTIGYSLPDKFLGRYNIQKVRIYVSGENLGEISKVGVPMDPEITEGFSGTSIGRTFPFMRSYSFGVQLSLR
ncbi:MAG: TonB-dependent receptor plug [Chitinophagaceae bacterium]|nr:TonB-dependent receptor plug [Chitinophagaceae bacterium]